MMDSFHNRAVVKSAIFLFVCVSVSAQGSDRTTHQSVPSGSHIPPGSYKESCTDVQVRDGRLRATCQNHNGSWVKTELYDPSRCPGSIANLNGHLLCDATHQSVASGSVHIPRVLRLTEDCSGVLWVAPSNSGLFSMKNGVWNRFEAPPAISGTPEAAFTDCMGRLWFGYRSGAIIIIDDGNIQPLSWNGSFGQHRAISGRGRHIWVGGDFGLVFFDGNRFQPVIPTDATKFGSVFGIEEDRDGGLWLGHYPGVIHIAEIDRRYLRDSSCRVLYERFDSLDGLPGNFRSGSVWGGVQEIQGTDGKIWFAAGGLAWLDPAHISRNLLPPPVSIQSLTADGKPYPYWTNSALPPLTRNLQIRFTALSLSIPERVRFRYRLDGFDSDWQDAGVRREAVYANLSPHKYRFHVIASNNDGVWNEAGASVDFYILPAYYQTAWFRLACAAAALLLLWATYQLLVQQLERRFAVGLEARLNERTRIARDLHDTLLQSFQGLMLRLQLVDDLLPEGKAKNQLEKTLQRADEAIREARRAVYDLRSSTAAPRDLAQAVRSLGDEFATENSATFHLVVEGAARDLNPIICDETYLITREALRNAFSHARAHHIEAEIVYGQRAFRLRIRDDGQGIPAQILEEGRPGHYGLLGMRERAKQVGGKLDFWSRAGAGTEIEISISGSVAYRTTVTRSFLPLLGRKRWGL